MQDSNKIHFESRARSIENLATSHRLTEINLEASRHSEQAAASALRSSVAAEDTSRSTRVNVQVGSISSRVIRAHDW